MLEESRRIFLQIESAKTKNTLNEKVRRRSAAAGTKVIYVFCRLCECYFILVHLQIKSIALSNSIWQNHYFGASEIFAFNLQIGRKVALSVLLSLLRMLCFSWENHVQTEKFMCKTEKIAYKTENEIRWKVLNRGLRSEKHFQSCFLPTMH